MNFICNHGFLYGACDVCLEVDRMLTEDQEDNWLELEEAREYDYYLDLDERELRKAEVI